MLQCVHNCYLWLFFVVLFLFQNQSIALSGNLEELMPPTERYIFNFNSKEELKRWHLYSDSEYGGMHILEFGSILIQTTMCGGLNSFFFFCKCHSFIIISIPITFSHG